MMYKKLLLSVTVLLVVGLLAACAAPVAEAPAAESAEEEAAAAEEAPAEAPAAEGEVEQVLVGAFDVGPGGDPQGIMYNNAAGNMWLAKIFTPLIMMSEDYTEHTSEDALAISWEPNEDATVWTFNLREGVVWHDGEPFTANDLKFTAELTSAPDSAVTRFAFLTPDQVLGWTEYNAGEADEIEGIRVIDDLTLEIELVQPNPRFYDEVRGFYALPEHAIDFGPSEIQSTDWWFTNPIGTGPFVFDSYEKDQFMALAPNENYWDGAPELDQLVNRYFVDETAAVLALESGDIDFTYVSADVAARFLDDPDYQVFSGPSFVTNMFMMNHDREVWQNESVRKAFLYGIDRQSILDQVFNGTAVAAPCQDPYPQFWPEDANYYEYDPEMAQALIEGAAAEGVTVEGVTFEIPTYYTSQLAKDILTVMQANMDAVGVDVLPTFLDVPTWRQVVRDGDDWDIAYRGIGAGPASYDPQWYLEDNIWGLDDPTYAELFADMDAAMTPEEYTAARTALCAYQNETQPFPYWWVSTRYGVASNDVEDFYFFPAPGGGPVVDNAENWNMK
jgi:peptide/nickel transport system substrate-binding protein